MELVEHLSQISLFRGLPPEHLSKLTAIIADKMYGKGQMQMIFADGDEGEGFYVVITGRVKVFKVSPDGKEQILHVFGPGAPFAEVPVFSGAPYPANAEPLEKSRLFFFPKKAFVSLIQETPSLAMNMLASLSQRLKQFSKLVETLSLKEVPGRLAAHILYLSDSNEGADEFNLDLAKSQLASLLGTIPETLSRIFGKMSSQGLIRISGPQIQIIDRLGLEELAEGEIKLS
jgi:CRP/FNR family transcriptional regulator